MTDRYDEMRVPPDPSLAEALRQRLHARMASASLDDTGGRSHLQVDAARFESEQHLVRVKENYVSVDSHPTSEVRSRRRLAMAAAAVVAVIGVAAIAINSMNSEDGVEPAPAVQPTVAPSTLATTPIAPRTETGFFAGRDGVPVTFIVPDDDWGVPQGWWVVHSKRPGREESGVAFWDVGNIYAEGCQWVLVDPPVGPTVDDLVSAFANLPGLAPTAAVDVTVDGYVGKQIEFTVPDSNECKEGQFALWQKDGNQDVAGPPDWGHPYPNMHNQLWILDVGGTRLVIDAYSFPDTSPQDRAALDAVLASIQIG